MFVHAAALANKNLGVLSLAMTFLDSVKDVIKNYHYQRLQLKVSSERADPFKTNWPVHPVFYQNLSS